MKTNQNQIKNMNAVGSFFNKTFSMFGKTLMGLLLLVFLAGTTHAQTIRYVKSGATGDGSSWANASGDIQEMLDGVRAMIEAEEITSGQVWIAAGLYPLDATLTMREGVSIYGGFIGTETSIDQRQKSDLNENGVLEPWEFTNATVLSGLTERTVLNQTAAFTVETTFDGLTITRGYSDNNGAGAIIRLNGTLQNSIITDNHIYNTAATSERFGAGVYMNNGGTLANSLVFFNTATVTTVYNNPETGVPGGHARGGGIYASGTSLIINCLISLNFAITEGTGNAEGGGVAVTSTSSLNSRFINCVIVDNGVMATGSGQAQGGAARQGAYINCTFVNNTAEDGAGGPYSISAANLNIVNSIIWGNEAPANPQTSGATITYSAVQGGHEGEGNINLAAGNTGTGPNFVDPMEDNYRLRSSSPCRNAGSNDVENLPDIDFDGNARIFGAIVDMGAFEWNGKVSVTFAVVGTGGTLSATVDGTAITSPALVDEGKIIVFTATPSEGNVVEEWKVNGEEVYGNTSNTYTVESIARATAVTVSFGQGNANIGDFLKTNPLLVWTNNNMLHVSGLTIGKLWSVYNISGKLVYQGIAKSDVESVSLPIHGMYIIQQGESSVKTVF
ncbi:MAG: hypothetical protein LBH22_08200 [Bacteroidales bacterium]|jgi:hypothetical protein|nr:hypothetical protein [Bacteroidales bacterium]